MTISAYVLGTPRVATERGGDCRARDLAQGRNVYGPHRFAATTHCQFSNGLLRLAAGVTTTAPTLTVEVWRGRVTQLTEPGWLSAGAIVIDSSLLSTFLTAVELVRISPEAVTVRLVAPVVADAFVTLRRGERQIRIQHGSPRVASVSTNRRVRWTGSPSPTGTTTTGRVEEATPAAALPDLYRFVASVDTVTTNASAFSATASSVTTADFGAGIGMDALNDRPVDHHAQLGDASRPRVVVT